MHEDKRNLNRLTRKVKKALQENCNETFQFYITNLPQDDHSIWQAKKQFKNHISQPHLSENQTKLDAVTSRKNRSFY